MEPNQLLQKYWGYPYLKPFQEEAIKSLLSGNDTIVLQPTGGGKSICYQIAGLILGKLTIVVCPLIALMKDQVFKLQKLGIQATYISSFLTKNEKLDRINDCISGKYSFLYISPERINTELFQQLSDKVTVGIIAVDEAHCISEWGHDFRPSYLKIKELRTIFPTSIWVALTGTANNLVKSEIIQYLELKNLKIVENYHQRRNISYSVCLSDRKYRSLLEYIIYLNGKEESSGIIYVPTRYEAEKLTERLKKDTNYESIAYYHAGLNVEDRNSVQEQWIAGKKKIIIATNAFGMGIDKPDVRWVLHTYLPYNLENYFQEAGRSGRDGNLAEAIIFTNGSDLYETRKKLKKSLNHITFLTKLITFFEECVINNQYEIDQILNEIKSKNKFILRETLIKLHKEDYIMLISDKVGYIKIKLMIDFNEALILGKSDTGWNEFLKSLLQLKGKWIKGYEIMINLNDLIVKPDSILDKSETIFELLAFFKSKGFIHFEVYPNYSKFVINASNSQKYNLTARLKLEITLIQRNIDKQKKAIEYVILNNQCRINFQELYFDHNKYTSCGICDCCQFTKNKFKIFHNISHEIVNLLLNKELNLDELRIKLFKVKNIEINAALNLLLESGKVRMTESYNFKLNR